MATRATHTVAAGKGGLVGKVSKDVAEERRFPIKNNARRRPGAWERGTSQSGWNGVVSSSWIPRLGLSACGGVSPLAPGSSAVLLFHYGDLARLMSLISLLQI